MMIDDSPLRLSDPYQRQMLLSALERLRHELMKMIDQGAPADVRSPVLDGIRVTAIYHAELTVLFYRLYGLLP